MQKYDTVVIGAGLLGSSVAMALARAGVSSVLVIDPDLEGSMSSSELNAGGVRATWTLPCNIEASKLSIDYFAAQSEEVGYRPCGYLWMLRENQLKGALAARELQQSYGWNVDLWDVPTLQSKVPFIDKVDDLTGALFAPRDGLLNPNLLKLHYRRVARAGGAKFLDRTFLSEAKSVGAGGASQGFELEISTLGPGDFESFLECKKFWPSHGKNEVKKERIFAARVVQCAGPWAPKVARILGYACPSKPVRRQVSLFECRQVDLTPYGMIVDPSGVYFHHEADRGLAGFQIGTEPHGYNFQYDGSEFFEEYIWPALYERSTGFEMLKHVSGWAGLYEVSPDESGIVGEVRPMPGIGTGRLFEAHSFSGHGVMHSYSAGVAIAELMTTGKYQTMDFSPFSGSRFDSGDLVREGMVI